jgi:hypothetical protein
MARRGRPASNRKADPENAAAPPQRLTLLAGPHRGTALRHAIADAADVIMQGEASGDWPTTDV